ncbi:uncharacterized protein LOC143039285 [Oratosquilla oratoria]|uniref:uncharacterized protein LOC143039285 n=1 Tax=Oratosquilla oratoria TaxID=337810 RepID=UPI003F775501
MLDALAFLPCDRVSEGMEFLRTVIPEQLSCLVDYFDATYVSGGYRRIQMPAERPGDVLPPLRMRRTPPLFPPELWNVHEVTLSGGHRTNNHCEAWNQAFTQMIGHDHPSVWIAIEALRKDQALVATTLLENARGQPPQKRQRRHTKDLQKRLSTLCKDFEAGQKDIEAFLKGCAHCIRF